MTSYHVCVCAFVHAYMFTYSIVLHWPLRRTDVDLAYTWIFIIALEALHPESPNLSGKGTF